MADFSKADRKHLVEIIRKGNLARYKEWLQEMNDLINKPFDYEKENEYDRCMDVTKKSRDFFKEAMRREDCYRNSWMVSGVAILLEEGYITKDDIETLSDGLKDLIILKATPISYTD